MMARDGYSACVPVAGRFRACVSSNAVFLFLKLASSFATRASTILKRASISLNFAVRTSTSPPRLGASLLKGWGAPPSPTIAVPFGSM